MGALTDKASLWHLSLFLKCQSQALSHLAPVNVKSRVPSTAPGIAISSIVRTLLDRKTGKRKAGREKGPGAETPGYHTSCAQRGLHAWDLEAPCVGEV